MHLVQWNEETWPDQQKDNDNDKGDNNDNDNDKGDNNDNDNDNDKWKSHQVGSAGLISTGAP